MLLPPLYLDECIDRRLALALRARGIDVTTVAEAATVSQDDRAQLVYATSQGRVLVSQNQIDFRRLHAQFRRDGRPHGGIMLIPQTVPFRRMEARVGLMLDLIATVPDHSSQLFTWTELQRRIIHGLRLPHWDEAVVREAVGWRQPGEWRVMAGRTMEREARRWRSSRASDGSRSTSTIGWPRRASSAGTSASSSSKEGSFESPRPLPRHSWCVIRISRHILRLADRMILSVKNPVRLDEASEPEPDLAVLRRETSQDRHPGPDDVLLMIEVADTSLAYDRGTKAPLYARHGIPELWIVDLRGERIEAHREPSPSGYRVVRVYGRGETLAPAFAPDFALEVDAVLGPRTEA